MRLKQIFIMCFYIITFNSCVMLSSVPKEKRFLIFDDMSILLYPDNKFELLNRLTENTKGSYTIIGDTVYLKSEYHQDSIEVFDIEFQNIDSLNLDSIYVKYFLKGKKSTYLSFIEFYNEESSNYKYFHPPFDEKIESNIYSKFRVRFGDGSSPRSEEHTSELQSRPHLVC